MVRVSALINAALNFLMKERGFSLEELAYRKYRLRECADTEEKEQIGKLWAERSGGKGLFFMVGLDEWKQLPAWVGECA